LVSKIHPKEKLLDEAILLAEKIAKFSQVTSALCKRAVR